MSAEYQRFFEGYVAAFNRSLGEAIDGEAIMSHFAEYFVSAGAGGVVRGGANDASFASVLEQGYAFYKSIGTRRMRLRRIEASPIDPDHDMVRVFYGAEYARKDGSAVTIDFDVVYFIQKRADGAKIFAFVAGDEMALYREHGLVEEDGAPA